MGLGKVTLGMDNFTELLDQYGGVILRHDALSIGYDDRAIHRMLRSGKWHRVRPGAYVTTELWAKLDDGGRHRVQARAVLAKAHPCAVLSHVSAAVELGAPVWGIDLGEVHVTRTDGRGGRREAGVVHHRGVLEESEVIERHGVRLVSGTRAALEVTTMASVEAALVTVNGLLHAKETSQDRLQSSASTIDRWPSSLGSALVLRLADSRIESAGESRAWHLFWRQRLPMPRPQHAVYDERGVLVAELDFALPELGVFIEFDGMEKYHRLRREGETLEAVILREKRREELVCRLTGWVCIRITWEDLSRPLTTARRIRAILVQRGLRTIQ